MSCSKTKWCTALNIDSLEATFPLSNATINHNCTEPINFAYLQRNGVPAGPPSPQLATTPRHTTPRHTTPRRAGPGRPLVLRRQGLSPAGPPAVCLDGWPANMDPGLTARPPD